MIEAIDLGRAAFRRQAWGDAYTQLADSDSRSPLGPEDLERLARAAYLTGKDPEGERIMARAHQERLERNDAQGAARCAFWLGFRLVGKGEMARGGGWLARASRLLDENRLDCVERGYLLVPEGLMALAQGNLDLAAATFVRVGEAGERFGDPDLTAISHVGRGQTFVAQGEIDRGVALLDQAMIAVTSGEVSPTISGILYCAVIESCQELFDLRRAQEWTTALSEWCEAQPDLVPFRGQCLVYRAEVMQIHGSWPEAMDEADRARERLAEPPEQAVGMAFYRLAELHRLRGEFEEAAEGYAEANQWGHSPQPGHALLRLAQGHLESAQAAISHSLDEAKDLVSRSRLLPAYIEIMIAARDVPASRLAADELSTFATSLGAPMLGAIAAQAEGALLLAEGEPRAALVALRGAWIAWQELDAPYEAARVRVLLALGCRELGDSDTAEMELDGATRAFRRLGAAPDVARVEKLSREGTTPTASGLTPRELEVLRLVATGKTNRAIADELFISEKTVARHVSNIFAKLGLSSRAAATAYAYERDLM